MAAMPDVLAAPGASSFKGAEGFESAPSAAITTGDAEKGAGFLSPRAYWRPTLKCIQQMFWLARREKKAERAEALGNVISLFDAQLMRTEAGKPEPTFKAPRPRRAKYQPAPYRDAGKPTGATLADVWPQ
jgi:hypothetical protein